MAARQIYRDPERWYEIRGKMRRKPRVKPAPPTRMKECTVFRGLIREWENDGKN